MPFPFVVFDNHASEATKLFLANNAKALKNLGYKKVLIEMNREQNPEILKAQLSKQ